MFLLVGEDVFVDFFYFFLEVINFSPDHRQFLLYSVLIVGIDQFFEFLAYVLKRGEVGDHGVSLF